MQYLSNIGNSWYNKSQNKKEDTLKNVYFLYAQTIIKNIDSLSTKNHKNLFSHSRIAINTDIWYYHVVIKLFRDCDGSNDRTELLSASVRGRRLKFNCLRVSSLEVRERNFRIFHRRKKKGKDLVRVL